jgi:hypothetical protein
MTIVDTKVTGISLRSRRRIAFEFDSEVEVDLAFEAGSRPEKPFARKRPPTGNLGNAGARGSAPVTPYVLNPVPRFNSVRQIAPSTTPKPRMIAKAGASDTSDTPSMP